MSSAAISSSEQTLDAKKGKSQKSSQKKRKESRHSQQNLLVTPKEGTMCPTCKRVVGETTIDKNLSVQSEIIKKFEQLVLGRQSKMFNHVVKDLEKRIIIHEIAESKSNNSDGRSSISRSNLAT